MPPADLTIRRATTVPQLRSASPLFDGPAREVWAARFLAAAGHHCLLAYLDGVPEPVGFVTGIEMLHPDKGVEMCLYELGVAENHRRRGIGRALTDALAALARSLDCYDLWVGVDLDNDPALATYRASGAGDDGSFAMLTWDFAEPADGGGAPLG